MIEQDGHLALGEFEMVFAVELLSWLCHKRVIGSITLRNALLAIKPPPTAATLADGRRRDKLATGGPRR